MTFTAGAFAVVVASLLLTTLAGGYWSDQPPAVLRWALAASCLVLWSGALAALLLRAAMWKQTPAQTARFVEQATPELRNNLINSILLSQDTDQVSPAFVQQAINETVEMTRDADLSDSLSYRQLQRCGLVAAIAAILLAAMVIFQPGPFQRGLTAALAPWRYVPRVNTIGGVTISPGDATVLSGQRVVITADIPALGDPDMDPAELAGRIAELKPRVIISGRPNSLLMIGDADGKFTCDLNAVIGDLDYAVIVGSDRWPEDKPFYSIKVARDVKIKSRHITYTYPAYMRRKPRKVTDSDGVIEAPVGSTARVKITLSNPIPHMAIQLKAAGEEERLMESSDDLMTFSATLPIDADGGYRMLLQDAKRRTIGALPDLSDPQAQAAGSIGKLMDGYYPISAVPDAPPSVKFLLPGRDLTVAPGTKVRMKIKVTDKFGLDAVTVLLGKSDGQVASVLQKDLKGSLDELIEYEYQVPADLPDDGTVVLAYSATAIDQRNLPRLKLAPQTASSKTFKITVQDATKLAAQAAKRYEELRKKLLEILNIQLSQRVNTAICKTQHTKLDQIRKTGAETLAGQKAVRDGMLWLLTKHKFDQDMLAIQQEIARLFANEAKTAVDQAQILAALGAIDLRDKACDDLAGSQHRIIEAIQSMLAIMPELTGKKEKKATAAEDLPPDVKAKLAELKAKLERFAEGQKKVIEAAKRLTKAPVDVFQGENEKILNDLKAAEDNWEKFINEAMADFSKLAEQDFSNPAMLKELLSVKCDVTMAKDALSKKAAEIAVAAAGSAKTKSEKEMDNLEKWLPDKPDREKWSMEAPAGGQENIEMPDLPDELEDLVGDLLEEEEDLFEEMADVSAKATDSGEKGLGWDALDGPISSMAAKGVTGNQLPNPSEISGRSGEGRQGKSTGEFVEDKAVGKGGRRTPTRLTPEPFSKGEVDDKGSEAEGGSTGGGKISGSGAEGLEGPVPPEIKKDMKRLSGKQASLINKAEQIRAQFKVTDHSNLRLFQAITLMNRVKDDLDKYRYHNALRARKEIVGALQDTAMLLGGDVDVQADASASMPKYIRDDIADAMTGTLPEEFREVLKQYYRRLNKEGQ